MESFEGRAERSYDREAVAAQAMSEAQTLLNHEGIENLNGQERHEATVELMARLSENNENRHVVEALARILTVESARAELEEKERELQALMEQYGHVA